MDIRAYSKSDLSEILDVAFEQLTPSGNWYGAFPKVWGYGYHIPEGYESLEGHPDSFRGHDHAIAHKTVQHPDLHPRMVELVETATLRNVLSGNALLADIFEHSGTHYATELALFDQKYIRLYAGFLFSNDMYYERFQHFDFVRIVRKWGWCSETYYLLFAYMFTQSVHFHADMDYLNFNGYPLHKGLVDEPGEADKLLEGMRSFMSEIGYNTDNEALNTFAAGMFGELVRKHIYPDSLILPEVKEKADKLENRYAEMIDKLQNGEPMVEEDNNVVELKSEKKSFSWDDWNGEDIPEI